MGELEKIVITAAFTVSGGVIVFVVGQVLSKFFIEPLNNLRRVIGEVRFNLAFHAVAIHTPIGRSKESSDKAQDALMKGSCDLISELHAIPLYGVTRFLAFGVLPPKGSIEKAAILLRGLSTHVHETGDKANKSLEEVTRRVERIEKLLYLKPLE